MMIIIIITTTIIKNNLFKGFRFLQFFLCFVYHALLTCKSKMELTEEIPRITLPRKESPPKINSISLEQGI